MVTEIKSLKQFEETLQTNKTVIVDFWAEWCGPCKLTAPQFHKAAEEVRDVMFVKVDVDEQTEIATTHKISSIPTMIVFENGQEKKRTVGFMPKEKIIQLLQ